MKKLILMLCMLLLLCSCVDGATKIGLDRLNWSQSDTVMVGPYSHDDYVVDGVNDQIEINQAIAYAIANSKSVVQLENYNYSINGTIMLSPHITLCGMAWPRFVSDRVNLAGDSFARLSIVFSTSEAIVLGNGSSVIGLEFLYPANMLYSRSYYPATILVGDHIGGAEVGYCHPMNPYYFINDTGAYTVLNYYHDIYGYFLERGILINCSVHGTEIERVHFLPGFAGLQNYETVYNYVAAYGTCIEIIRADGFIIRDCKMWDMGYGIKITGTHAQPQQGGIITDCMFDEVPHPLTIAWSKYVDINNVGTFAAAGSWTAGVHYTTALVNYTSFELTDCDGYVIRGGTHASGGHIVKAIRSNTSISSLILMGWGNADSGVVSGIQFTDCNHLTGFNLVNGCTFRQGGNDDVGVGITNCKYVMVTNNIGHTGAYSVAIGNAATDYYTISNNMLHSTSGIYNDALGAPHQVIEHNLDT